MEISLVWIDKKWKSKGIANNLWLHIYPNSKSYKKHVSPYMNTNREAVIEITRKSDIEKMIKNLKYEGYSELIK